MPLPQQQYKIVVFMVQEETGVTPALEGATPVLEVSRTDSDPWCAVDHWVDERRVAESQ